MLLIKNAKIHVGNGEVLNDYDILIENGIIKKVDKSINENIDGSNCKVIDANGREVFPGFIEPMTGMGCIDFSSKHADNQEKSNPITPEMNVKYALNPEELVLQTLYKRGITSIGAMPGNTNIADGQMAVFKTYGVSPNKMLVRESVGLKCSVVNNVKETYGEKNVFPKTRMGIFNALDGMIKEGKSEIVQRVLKGEVPMFVTADKKQEIDALLHITKDYDIKLVICGGSQVHKCVEEIKSQSASLILGNLLDMSIQIYNDTDLNKVKELIGSGVTVGISSFSSQSQGDRETFLWNAIELYKAGVSSEKIVEMLTLNHAKLLGVSDKIGSIEEGKDADITIFSSNPIEFYNSRVTHAIIEGNIVYAEGSEEIC